MHLQLFQPPNAAAVLQLNDQCIAEGHNTHAYVLQSRYNVLLQHQKGTAITDNKLSFIVM